jgi:hypothetical protein
MGYGSYAWKLDGTPSGRTFLALVFATCEFFVRSAYVCSSRFVMSLARFAKEWCNGVVVAFIINSNK